MAAGEPATRRGFPPSLFAALPRLLERAGPVANGSITGIYTILIEGDMSLDPVAEEVQAILDGHVILSSELAQRNHFPAIDVLHSRSRLMDTVAPAEQRADAARIRELMARYAEVELLVRVGEYQHGTDPLTDEAIGKIGRINSFLRQASATHSTLVQTRQQMREIAACGTMPRCRGWSCCAGATRSGRLRQPFCKRSCAGGPRRGPMRQPPPRRVI